MLAEPLKLTPAIVLAVVKVAAEPVVFWLRVGTLAAGIVFAEKKLDNLIPLYSENVGDIPATQFNLKYIEKAGLVKFDLLGLKTLTGADGSFQLELPAASTPSGGGIADGDYAIYFFMANYKIASNSLM